MHSSVPVAVIKHITEYIEMNNRFDHFIFNEDVQLDSAQCFTTRPVPQVPEWDSTYKLDKDTTLIKKLLAQTSKPPFKKSDIEDINLAYHIYLQNGCIVWRDNRLILIKETHIHNKNIALIVVPSKLRKLIFDHYHGSPTGGHMGEYPTLY